MKFRSICFYLALSNWSISYSSRTRNTKHLAVLCLFIVIFSYRKHQIQANKQKHSSDHRKGHLYTVKQKYSCFFFLPTHVPRCQFEGFCCPCVSIEAKPLKSGGAKQKRQKTGANRTFIT